MAQQAQRSRLLPEQRRRQLVETAAALLSEHGVDKVQVSEVALAAGVSRPVVYRFFANRQALIVGLLETFEADLRQRFVEQFRGMPEDLADAVQLFVNAVCDVIESSGAGVWHLLDSKGPDPEIARAGTGIIDRLISPWHGRIADLTGASPTEVISCAKMLTASGRAVLDLWIDGALTRDEAVRDATRAIAALLEAFAAPQR